MNPERPACPSQAPADPRELAREIAQDARSRGGLLIFTDFERMLCLGATNGRGAGLPLLVRGALVALASTPATGVVINSGRRCVRPRDPRQRPGPHLRRVPRTSGPGGGDDLLPSGRRAIETGAARAGPRAVSMPRGSPRCGGRDQGAGRHRACSTSRPVGRFGDRGPRRDEPGLKGGMRTAGVERVIAHVLLWGGLLGGLLVVLGLILFIGRGDSSGRCSRSSG